MDNTDSDRISGWFRVLVTGSRNWSEVEVVGQQMIHAGDLNTTRRPMLLVSGACPTGADRIAETFAEAWGWQIERHPADWSRHGRGAGFRRNAEMVAAGADLCLAFIKDGSRGASHTADLAEHAGIPTLRTTSDTMTLRVVS